jgi:peptidoglycan hydrolase-like protein with peptidoglycan-binding domain
MRTLWAVATALLLASGSASAQDSTDFIKRVQEELKAQGFYAGPVNGDFGPYTQAALAQYQLSRPLPASGQLDVDTLLALGVARDASASEGATADSRGELPTQTPENTTAGGG